MVNSFVRPNATQTHLQNASASNRNQMQIPGARDVAEVAVLEVPDAKLVLGGGTGSGRSAGVTVAAAAASVKSAAAAA